MKTKSGILEFGKREEEAMRVVLHHAKIDIADSGNGTYARSDKLDNVPDTKEIAKAKQGIELLEWILDFYK